MADNDIDNLKLPPHSVEAEQSLLGGLLIDNESSDKIADVVTSKDFYRNDHSTIYQHIIKVIESNQPADIVTVAESLEKNDELAAVGGLSYLGLLAENTPAASNIRGYAQIVRERSIMRNLVQVGSDIAESAYSPQGRNAQELLDESEAKIFQIADDGMRAAIGFEDIKHLLPKVLAGVEERGKNKGNISGVATGYTDLDNLTSGLQSGDLVVLAGRPSMGKTALALNIAENVAIDQNLPVAIFSMEMSSEQLTTRLLGSVGKVNATKLRSGQDLDPDDWDRLSEALGRLNDAPIFIDQGGALNSYELRARARRLQRQEGQLGLIVIDYIQLMSAAGGRQSENRATEVSEISRSLKSLAKELNVPIVALSQLNRALESRPDKRPMMSDLRESGAIEQDADVILFIYRDDQYNEDSPDKGLAEILISKQRNGPTGKIKLTFLGEYTRFENYASPGYAPEF
ncbi:replicative DNA helicase [Methylophilaceae bacterium]|jgi:replicative DNA helicase|nr:replicative DNA helicase [Methylophilaceae bacterium]|tara:strand:- start:4310 stop:5686 length:1377 start_codon:yes stop_codon:yes gene_type:complete